MLLTSLNIIRIETNVADNPIRYYTTKSISECCRQPYTMKKKRMLRTTLHIIGIKMNFAGNPIYEYSPPPPQMPLYSCTESLSFNWPQPHIVVLPALTLSEISIVI